MAGDSAVVQFEPVPEWELRADMLHVPANRLEVLSSTRRWTTTGAMLGGIVTAFAGFFIGQRAFGNLCDGSPTAGFTCKKDESMAVPLFVVGGLAGAGVGALVGHSVKQEKWAPVIRPR